MIKIVEIIKKCIYIWNCPDCGYINEDVNYKTSPILGTVKCNKCNKIFEVIRQY